MRIGELLHRDVVDADGVPLGSIDDVRLVQDGPYIEGFGAALRVDALIVGRGALATRLGFHRHGVRGPWLLKRLFESLERRAHVVSWDDVVDVGDEGEAGPVRVRCRKDDLPTLHDLGDDG